MELTGTGMPGVVMFRGLFFKQSEHLCGQERKGRLGEESWELSTLPLWTVGVSQYQWDVCVLLETFTETASHPRRLRYSRFSVFSAGLKPSKRTFTFI